jgi:hypothetical protein
MSFQDRIDRRQCLRNVSMKPMHFLFVNDVPGKIRLGATVRRASMPLIPSNEIKA